MRREWPLGMRAAWVRRRPSTLASLQRGREAEQRVRVNVFDPRSASLVATVVGVSRRKSDQNNKTPARRAAQRAHAPASAPCTLNLAPRRLSETRPGSTRALSSESSCSPASRTCIAGLPIGAHDLTPVRVPRLCHPESPADPARAENTAPPLEQPRVPTPRSTSQLTP